VQSKCSRKRDELYQSRFFNRNGDKLVPPTPAPPPFSASHSNSHSFSMRDAPLQSYPPHWCVLLLLLGLPSQLRLPASRPPPSYPTRRNHAHTYPSTHARANQSPNYHPTTNHPPISHPYTSTHSNQLRTYGRQPTHVSPYPTTPPPTYTSTPSFIYPFTKSRALAYARTLYEHATVCTKTVPFPAH